MAEEESALGFLFTYVLVYSVPGMRQQLRGRGGRQDGGVGRGQAGKGPEKKLW